MRILTVLGTRPEIIRLSGVIDLLDTYAEHVLVDTGQNYDEKLSAIFFGELGVRRPDEQLCVRGGAFGEQAGQILERSEAVLLKHRPDRILVLGDTNSGLAAIVARRLGIPVYHMEAGNRCYDDRVPEEVNRRIIDHCSSVLLPYTNRSRENLLAEGIRGANIYVTGNPIKQVLDRFSRQVESSNVLERERLSNRKYFLVTAHRAENVDDRDRLSKIVTALQALHSEYGFTVVCSVHPRTRQKLETFGISQPAPGIRFLDPVGFFDFVRLERSAFCILSDSGTVQEEACLFGVPNVSLRDVTERPETLECGSNVLAGCEPARIEEGVRVAVGNRGAWRPPVEYLAENVAETVCRIVISHRLPDAAELDWRRGARIP